MPRNAFSAALLKLRKHACGAVDQLNAGQGILKRTNHLKQHFEVHQKRSILATNP